jgi:hypothetical protein
MSLYEVAYYTTGKSHHPPGLRVPSGHYVFGAESNYSYHEAGGLNALE